MVQRTFKTDEVCTFSVGSATFQGRIWRVQPLLPSPLDATPQAATYRTANRNKVREVEVYSNIRYGQAPVGDLRFAPPEPYVYPSGTHDASEFQTPPHQTFAQELGRAGRFNPYGDPLAGPLNWPRLGTKESEDCLRLTIFRPRGRTNCPVIYHVHGGGWMSFHGMTPQHFGAYIAAHMGVVVVLVGYRLSTFGHFPIPGAADFENPSVAYLDQRLGLEWVNDNGANCGADTSKILVTGSSAGGAATLLFLADPDAQSLFSSAWADSGGGGGNYGTSAFYGPRVERFITAVRLGAPFLTSLDPQYRTVQDAYDDGRDDLWVWQNAVRVEQVQAMADIGPTVTAASVRAVLAGTGNLVASRRSTPENVFPFRRGDYANAIEAAKAGAFTKPTVFSYAENEASVIAGNEVPGMRNYFNNLDIGTLNGWARRLGYTDFADYANGWAVRLAPFGRANLGEIPDSLFPSSLPQNTLVEEKRTLYGHSIYGYPAWRMARAMKETDSAPAWLALCNFGANGQYCGHSSLVSYNFGNADWRVGLPAETYPDANPPGRYANLRMDSLYFVEIACRAYAKMAADGDPSGPYEYENGFNLFEGNPPADGGQLNQPWPQYNPVGQPGHHIVLGKYSGDYNNLNAVDPNLDSQRDAKISFRNHMGGAYLDYLARLEP